MECKRSECSVDTCEARDVHLREVARLEHDHCEPVGRRLVAQRHEQLAALLVPQLHTRTVQYMNIASSALDKALTTRIGIASRDPIAQLDFSMYSSVEWNSASARETRRGAEALFLSDPLFRSIRAQSVRKGEERKGSRWKGKKGTLGALARAGVRVGGVI